MKLRGIGETKNSRIILAVDVTKEFSRASGMDILLYLLKLFNSVKDYVAGVKIGLPTLLSAGPETIYRLINEYEWNFFFIADLKIADISYVNTLILSRLKEIGFDAAIIHSFIGGEKGLMDTVEAARDIGIGVVSVVAMSHPGAHDILNKNFDYLLKLSMDSGVDAIVLPATFPEYIRRAREAGFKGVIMSPGVGAQGAKPGSAIEAGADFEIIGRLIYKSEDPATTASELVEVLRWK